jgi:hypothetical protein
MEELKEINPIQALLDDKNVENIFLYDENDKAVEFEQIAIIPLKDVLYAILKPVQKMEGVNDDEAIAFELREGKEGAEDTLVVVTDEALIKEIFNEYYKLINDKAK